MHEAARARIHQLECEIADAEVEITRFEERYNMTLSEFETEILAETDSLEAHAHYNDWFYRQSVLEEKQRLPVNLNDIELT